MELPAPESDRLVIQQQHEELNRVLQATLRALDMPNPPNMSFCGVCNLSVARDRVLWFQQTAFEDIDGVYYSCIIASRIKHASMYDLLKDEHTIKFSQVRQDTDQFSPL